VLSKNIACLYYDILKSWHTRSGRSFSLTGDKAMKRIESMRHLEEYGIIPLTGESDAHMYRILCDVTKRGKAIIERTLALGIAPSENWNSGSKDDPHVGSFLLPEEFLSPLAVFCLLSDTKIVEVWLMKDGSVIGFGVEDIAEKEQYTKRLRDRVRKIFYARSSDRNVHQMSGRTA
jgi:hypothetical protein